MTFRQFLRIVEIRTKIVSVSTLLLGLLYVLLVRSYIEPVRAILVVLAALFVDMATTAFNTYFDFERSVDSKATNRESDKVLVHEGLAPGYALVTSLVFYFLAAVLGIVLTLMEGWIVLVLGLASLAVGYLYSGGPYPISRTPLGELFAGGFLGTILFLVVAVTQGLPINGPLVIASIPSLIHIAGILSVNNTCDIVGDRKAGRKTLSILIGVQASKLLIGLELLAAYFCILLVLPPTVPTVALIVFGLCASFVQYRSMLRMGFSHETKGPSMGAISKSFMFFTLVFALAIGIQYSSSL